MTVDPVTATSSQITRTGEFEPNGISEEEAIARVEKMYQLGIGMMQSTISSSI